MNFSRLMAVPLVVAALLLMTTNSYHAPVVSAVQKEPVATKKAAPVEYVCPMHAEVQSTSRGVCPKCHMTLVKKRKVKVSVASGATRGR